VERVVELDREQLDELHELSTGLDDDFWALVGIYTELSSEEAKKRVTIGWGEGKLHVHQE
jgi:hypothetical protein